MNSVSLTQLLPTISTSFGNTPFLWDSWSRLFIFLIVGIGLLVAVNAWGYFKSLNLKIKFFSTLIPFALAMSGVVTLDNLLLLFIAWEATSFLSYYLITFNGDSADARRGGQQSLLITALGGLALLAGILMLGFTENAWTLSSAISVDLSSKPLGGWIAGLIVLGALTKSAQFPFHFWLPGAMTAPTPASAYLHSATMVKAGVYILHRLWPMLNSVEHISWVVFSLGFITFAWGTFVSLLQLDLKGVLAGTTLAHLGLMVAMIAWPDHDLSSALFALVLSHAAYKAGLFLFSGVIERLAGTRRIDLMSGLREQSPLIFGIGLILAGASLGLPGTLAYHAKGLIDLPWLWKAALTVGFLILGKAGLLVAVRPFLGTSEKKGQASKNLTLMWASPLILGIFSWICVPFGWVEGTDWSWKSILLSVFAAAIAISLLRRWTPQWQATLSKGPWLKGADLFDQIWYAHLDFAKFVRDLVQPQSLSLYVLTMMAVFSIGMTWLLRWTDLRVFNDFVQLIHWNDIFIWLCAGKGIATLLVLKTTVPIHSVLFLGLVGYLFALVLAFAGAPDLAMTQFSVETLSILVLLFAIRGVKKPAAQASIIKISSVGISVLVGIAVSVALATASLSSQDSRLRDYFAETSWIEAHGRNVVNVILVDYRALDTLGEITVLGIVTLGIFLILSSRSKGRAS